MSGTRLLRVLVAAAALIGCSGGNTNVDGSSAGSPPVVGIYSSCPADTLAQTYVNPVGFTLSYPSSWSAANEGSTYDDLTTPYVYVPTGRTSAVSAQANLEIETGNAATSEDDVETKLDAIAHDYSSAVVRSYDIGGHRAVAWWYESSPPQPGCAGCPGDPGPDYVTIGVAFGVGLQVVEAFGSARANAPSQVFCDIQASEGSVTIP